MRAPQVDDYIKDCAFHQRNRQCKTSAFRLKHVLKMCHGPQTGTLAWKLQNSDASHADDD